MNEDRITLLEVANDGKTINLYYHGLMGLYVAYGMSAYLLSRVTEVKPSYSHNMQMPVAVINVEHYEALAQKIGRSEGEEGFRRLTIQESIDLGGYSDWAFKLREEKRE